MAFVTPNYFDNFDDWLDELPVATEDHQIVVGNDADYARYVQQRAGFFVVDPDRFYAAVQAGLQALVDEAGDRGVTDEVLRRRLQAIARAHMADLQSYTGRFRPPAYPRDELREAHPGGWADVLFHMVTRFFAEVDGREVDAEGAVAAAQEVLS